MPQTLYRSFFEERDGGQSLPMPFQVLAKAGVTLRQGQVSITSAGPGVGKTAFWSNYVAYARDVSTLYLSPDSDIMTVGPRLVATTTGQSLAKVLHDFDNDPVKRAEHLETMKLFTHVQFSFQSSPTYQDIIEELQAYEMVHGDYPELIILDNTRNVYAEEGSEGEHQRHGATVDFFHEISRQTGAHCALLHHLTGEYENGNEPPPLRALLGKIGKQPRLALNLFGPDENTMGVVVAKNTNGASSPAAYEWHEMRFDKDKQLIY